MFVQPITNGISRKNDGNMALTPSMINNMQYPPHSLIPEVPNINAPPKGLY